MEQPLLRRERASAVGGSKDMPLHRVSRSVVTGGESSRTGSTVDRITRVGSLLGAAGADPATTAAALVGAPDAGNEVG